MTPLLIAFLAVLLMPLFIASWRTSLLGLSCQGALMGWIAYRHNHHLSVDTILAFADLVVVRAVAAPLFLYRVLRSQHAPPRNDVIPPNLLSWTASIVLVVFAFQFAGVVIPVESDEQTLVAVSSAGLLLGLLVLATQSDPFSQMVGALRLANAIALFELGDPAHQEAIGIRLVQTGALMITVAMFAWYLRTLKGPASAAAAEEGVTL
jgi:hydrogenase-4 component E